MSIFNKIFGDTSSKFIKSTKETVDKIQFLSPKEVQTGPAVRGDLSTINRHLQFLEQYPQYQAIYKLISEGIINSTNK